MSIIRFYCFLGSVPASSSSSVPASVASGSSLGLDKFKKPEGSWDCAVCLVQNKADATKCAACEAAKPGTQSEFTGRTVGTRLFELSFQSTIFTQCYRVKLVASC